MTRRFALIALLLLASGCPAKRVNPIPPGAAWKKLDTVAYKGKQDDVFFVDADTGWYGNGAGLLYKTTDGGSTWTEVASKPGTYFRALGFVDAQHGFAGNIAPGYFPGVTDPTPLYETTDGGATWAPVAGFPLPEGGGVCAIDIVTDTYVNAGVLDKRTVIHVAGRVGGPAHIVRSVDGGKTWTLLDVGDKAAMILDVHFFDASNGIVVAASDRQVETSHARVLRTSDGGATWTIAYESARAFELGWKTSFPTRDTGYVSVQSYDPEPAHATRYVAKTTDGGKTWRELPVGDIAQNEYGIGFVNEDVGWVGGAKQGFATVDGGRTWTAIDLGRATNKFRVVRVPGGGIVVYAIGVDLHKLDARTPPRTASLPH